MTQRLHSLLRASAGTGKTFRLSSRFLELLFENDDASRILATTFTRKAAGEILDRVLERLCRAALDPKKLEELNGSMQGANVTRDQCIGLLAKLTRRIDRFKIRTLDAFFVHVAQLYSLDLGMTPGWGILEEDEDEELREEALTELIESLGRDEMIDLLRALSSNGAMRAIRRTLEETVTNGRSSFLESGPKAWSAFDAGEEVSDSQTDALLALIDAYPIPKTKTGKDDGRWAKALAKVRERIEHGDAKAALKDGLLPKHLNGEPYYGTEVDEESFAPIAEFVLQAMRFDLARRNQSVYGLLEEFEVQYERLKSARGAYRFEDVPGRIAPLGHEGFAQLTERELDMWFRLDGQIDHLLLDEFQDTAPVQWRILSRLAHEILDETSDTRSLFVVGDVKQSIYDWRGAEPRLLTELEARFEELKAHAGDGRIEIEPLQKSWRSSGVILDTVNRVFQTVSQSTFFAEGPAHEGAVEWSRGYEEHQAARDLPGAAFLVEAACESTQGTEKQAAVIQVAMERVAQIREQAPHATIGVLLRTNKHISRCINLLSTMGIRASGEGGNRLTDSAAVHFFLSALHLADHPDDTLAAYHVSTSPLGELIGLQDGCSDAARRSVSAELRSQLVREGYGALISRLAKSIDRAAFGPWDWKRLAQLIDLAYTYDAEATLRPSDFVRLVRSKRVEDPSAALVKVMTVHKSKGLEFDAVVLPELDESASKRRGYLSLRNRESLIAPLEAVSREDNELVMKSEPTLHALWESGKIRGAHEFLSLLYVAMTRAAHRLDMIVQAPTKSSDTLTAARLLREQLDCGEPDDDGVLWMHDESDETWWPTPEDTTEESELTPSATLQLQAPAHDERSQRASGRTETSLGAELLEPRSDRARVRGLLLHRWFQEIHWLEEFSLDDAQLLKLGLTIDRDDSFVRECLAEFRACLAQPDLKAMLTKGHRAVEAVWRERPFSVYLPTGSGETLRNGVFDRVVIDSEHIELIDFKTDRIEAAAAHEQSAHHVPQLEAYARVLEEMFAGRKLRIDKWLAFTSPGVTVQLA